MKDDTINDGENQWKSIGQLSAAAPDIAMVKTDSMERKNGTYLGMAMIPGSLGYMFRSLWIPAPWDFSG